MLKGNLYRQGASCFGGLRDGYMASVSTACPRPSHGVHARMHAAAAAAAAPSAAQPQNYPVDESGLSTRQLQQLRTFLDYMLEVNKSMNLTAVRDPDEAWQRHVGDSLALLPVMDKHLTASLRPAAPRSSTTPAAAPAAPAKRQQARAKVARDQDKAVEAEQPSSSGSSSSSSSNSSDTTSSCASTASSGLRVIDVGTGAGLPGMVLAVARPHWKVTLLDSLRKRCDFLSQAAERAGVANVNVVWSRAEEAGQNLEHREVYDVAVARAVAETRVLAELCLPFVRRGGLWFAAKGPQPQAEVDAARPAITKLGGQLLALDMVNSFSADGQRTVLVAAKQQRTPAKYPRRPGTPNSEPL